MRNRKTTVRWFGKSYNALWNRQYQEGIIDGYKMKRIIEWNLIIGKTILFFLNPSNILKRNNEHFKFWSFSLRFFVVYDKIFYTKSQIPTEKAEQHHVSWLYSYKYKLHVSQIFIEYDINLWAYNTFKFNGVVNGVLFSTVFARIWTWFWKSDFLRKLQCECFGFKFKI